VSDVTRRDVRKLEEGSDLVGTLSKEVEAFGNRQPHGEALRSKSREAAAALADAQGKLDGVRRLAEALGDVRS
jgi:hypothetical protein